MTRLLPLWLALCCCCHVAHAAQTHVAVASNFIEPMRALVAEFELRTEHSVIVSFGSSGKLYAQIRHGAPFDLFLSADDAKPAQLANEGFARAQHVQTYAIGALVLWSPNEVSEKSGPSLLSSGEFDRLALANPRLAPYGKAAVEVLAALGLEHKFRSRWVMGENVAQTFQFVASGNASLGFIAASQWHSAEHQYGGTAWHIDPSLYTPIRQDMVMLRRGKDNPATLALREFLQSGYAQRLIHTFGYLGGKDSSV